LRIAYLADLYPRINEPFIDREVAALRTQGVHVETASVFRIAPEETVDPQERDATFYLRSASALRILMAHLRLLAGNPRRYCRALALALGTAAPGLREFAVQLWYFAVAGVLAQHLSQRRVCHLHNHATGAACTVAMLAASLGGFDFSFTVHGSYTFFVPVERHLGAKLRHARFVRCISYFCRSQCLFWLPPQRWTHLHVVHCGVDPEFYAPREHEGPGTHLVFVGRLAAAKGLPILLDALARLKDRQPPVRLTLVGAGAERTDIEARVRAQGLDDHVHFAGYQTPTQVAEWLRSADVFVLPSLAEGVPVAAMEAMAAGVPVIATRVGGLYELIDDGVSGFLVPAAAPRALAARIAELLDSAELRNRVGHAGREKVRAEFDRASETARLRRLFEWAAAERTAAPTLGDDARESLHGYDSVTR
jgi:glycosyltransferase involved in cell wall biosynthesis